MRRRREDGAAPAGSALGGGGEDSVSGVADLAGFRRRGRVTAEDMAEGAEELGGVDLLLRFGSPRDEIEGGVIGGVVSDFSALFVIGIGERFGVSGGGTCVWFERCHRYGYGDAESEVREEKKNQRESRTE